MIPEIFERCTINERKMESINFDKSPGAAAPPDTLLIRSMMGTAKTKCLVDYLHGNQVPKDT